MIRERREEDLDVLAEILQSLDPPTLGGREPRAWLTEHAAERSWVFDQAPVHVAPTRNVIGHIQIHRLPDDRAGAGLLEHAGAAADDVLVVGKHVVRTGAHQHGYARYLLTESVGHIRREGKLPVVDLGSCAFPAGFYEKYGFTEAVGARFLVHRERPAGA